MYLTRLLDMLNYKLRDLNDEKFSSFAKVDALNAAQEDIYSWIIDVDPSYGENYQDYTVPSTGRIDIPEDFVRVVDMRTLSTQYAYGEGGYGVGGYGGLAEDGDPIYLIDKREAGETEGQAFLIHNEIHFQNTNMSEPVRLYYDAVPLPMFRTKVSSADSTAIFYIETVPMLGEIIGRDNAYIGCWLYVQDTSTSAYEQKQIVSYTHSTGKFILGDDLATLPDTNTVVELATPIPRHLRRYIVRIATAELSDDDKGILKWRSEVTDNARRNVQRNPRVRNVSMGMRHAIDS